MSRHILDTLGWDFKHSFSNFVGCCAWIFSRQSYVKVTGFCSLNAGRRRDGGERPWFMGIQWDVYGDS